MSDTNYNPATLEFIKKESAKRSRQRKWSMVVGGVLLVAISAAGYFGLKAYNEARGTARAKELVANITTPGAGFDAMRKAVEAGEITRDQAWAAGREAMEKMMKERVDGFFNTPVKERDKYLDKLIDEELKRQKEWEARRKEWEARQATQPTTRPDRGERRGGDGERREQDRGTPGGGGMRGGDNTSPVDRAKQQEFRAAMQRRAQERGVELGRGGGRGGWGGGRGPGGGGGGGGR